MKFRTLAILVLTAGLATPAWAAYDYGFFRITNNASQDIASQLNVSVDTPATGVVTFSFTNSVGIASSVAQIHVDNAAGVLASMTGVSNVQASPSASNLSFASGGTPASLPGGDAAPYNFVSNFRASATSPAPHRGINEAGESVVMTFSLAGGQTFSDVIAAISANTLRFGMHATGIGGQSDSFMTGDDPTERVVVPAPAAVLLGVMGLGACTIFRRNKLA